MLLVSDRNEGAVYADKAYDSQAVINNLESKVIKACSFAVNPEGKYYLKLKMY